MSALSSGLVLIAVIVLHFEIRRITAANQAKRDLAVALDNVNKIEEPHWPEYNAWDRRDI